MAGTDQRVFYQPHINGLTEDEKKKIRPYKISSDIKFMEQLKRVTELRGSQIFMEKMHQIYRGQTDGNSSIIFNRMKAQRDQVNSNVFKKSNHGMPINDIRCEIVTGEKQLRCNLAAVFRMLDLHGWTHGLGGQISARLNDDKGHFLVNPYGLLHNEITASSLVTVNMQGEVVDQGTTNFGIHLAEFQLHSQIYASRPDINCIIHIKTPHVTAVSSLKCGLLPVCHESIVIGDISTHKNLGDGQIQKVALLTNRGAFCCGETIEEAFFNCSNTTLACETQAALMPMGIENIHLIAEEDKKAIFEASLQSPASPINIATNSSAFHEKFDKPWKIGLTEFEALKRIVGNADFRSGYYNRKPLLQSGHKENNVKRWLTTPNIYRKIEVFETGKPHPRITSKWVSHKPSTDTNSSGKINKSLQFVPKNTNPNESKQLQQQIKDDRIAGKISAGPQSCILKKISCETAKTLQDPTSSQSSPIKRTIYSLLSASARIEKKSPNNERCLLQIEQKKLPEPSEPEVVQCDDIVTINEEMIGEKLSADVNALNFDVSSGLHATPDSDIVEGPELSAESCTTTAKEVDNDEIKGTMNALLDTIEKNLQEDANDFHPGRSSPSISKKSHLDNSTTELIHSLNDDIIDNHDMNHKQESSLYSVDNNKGSTEDIAVDSGLHATPDSVVVVGHELSAESCTTTAKSFDNDEIKVTMNALLDTIEKNLQEDANDSHPGRSSSIEKNSQLDDSMMEPINSMNVDTIDHFDLDQKQEFPIDAVENDKGPTEDFAVDSGLHATLDSDVVEGHELSAESGTATAKSVDGDEIEVTMNALLDTNEKNLQEDANDPHPRRSSLSIPKNSQLNDSTTELINSLNVDIIDNLDMNHKQESPIYSVDNNEGSSEDIAVDSGLHATIDSVVVEGHELPAESGTAAAKSVVDIEIEGTMNASLGTIEKSFQDDVNDSHPGRSSPSIPKNSQLDNIMIEPINSMNVDTIDHFDLDQKQEFPIDAVENDKGPTEDFAVDSGLHATLDSDVVEGHEISAESGTATAKSVDSDEIEVTMNALLDTIEKNLQEDANDPHPRRSSLSIPKNSQLNDSTTELINSLNIHIIDNLDVNHKPESPNNSVENEKGSTENVAVGFGLHATPDSDVVAGHELSSESCTATAKSVVDIEIEGTMNASLGTIEKSFQDDVNDSHPGRSSPSIPKNSQLDNIMMEPINNMNVDTIDHFDLDQKQEFPIDAVENDKGPTEDFAVDSGLHATLDSDVVEGHEISAESGTATAKSVDSDEIEVTMNALLDTIEKNLQEDANDPHPRRSSLSIPKNSQLNDSTTELINSLNIHIIDNLDVNHKPESPNNSVENEKGSTENVAVGFGLHATPDSDVVAGHELSSESCTATAKSVVDIEIEGTMNASLGTIEKSFQDDVNDSHPGRSSPSIPKNSQLDNIMMEPINNMNVDTIDHFDLDQKQEFPIDAVENDKGPTEDFAVDSGLHATLDSDVVEGHELSAESGTATAKSVDSDEIEVTMNALLDTNEKNLQEDANDPHPRRSSLSIPKNSQLNDSTTELINSLNVDIIDNLDMNHKQESPIYSVDKNECSSEDIAVDSGLHATIDSVVVEGHELPAESGTAAAKSVVDIEIEGTMNASLGTIEKSFQDDVNDSHPGRSSPSIPKNSQLDNIMMEPINSMNVDTIDHFDLDQKQEFPIDAVENDKGPTEDFAVDSGLHATLDSDVVEGHELSAESGTATAKSVDSDEIEVTMNALLDTIEKNLQEDANDPHPRRSSLSIPKNSQLNDSTTELINSLNVDIIDNLDMNHKQESPIYSVDNNEGSSEDIAVDSGLHATIDSVVVEGHELPAESGTAAAKSVVDIEMEGTMNASLGTIEKSFQDDVNDSHPGRSSPSIPKNDQLDNIMTEPINSLNVDTIDNLDLEYKQETSIDSVENDKGSTKGFVVGFNNKDKHENFDNSYADEEVKAAEQIIENDIHELHHDKLQSIENKRKGKKKAKQRVDNVLNGDRENVEKDVNTFKPEADLGRSKSKKKKGKKKK